MNLFRQFFGDSRTGATINVMEAQEKLKGKQPPFLLDVRTPDEYRTGHIAGATLIPLNELRARIRELPQEREILCVCRSGSRSGVAAQQIAAAGLTSVNMSGGMNAWLRAGFPIRKGAVR